MKKVIFFIAFCLSADLYSQSLPSVSIFERILSDKSYDGTATGGLFPTDAYCDLHYNNSDASFTMLGDSRIAVFLGHYPIYDPFATDVIAGRIRVARIDPDNNSSQLVINVDDPSFSNGRVFSQGFHGKKARDMIGTIRYCRKKPYVHWYRTVGPTVLHIGGNDVNGGMKDLAKQEGDYKLFLWIFNLLHDPWEFLVGIFNGSSENYVEAWWMWQMEALARKSAYDAGAVAYSVAKDNAQPVMIVLPAIAWNYDVGIPNSKVIMRQLTVFSRFNAILLGEIGAIFAPYMVGPRPLIIFENMIPFSFDPANYALPVDWVHFSDKGNTRWASDLAKTMVVKGWFPVNPAIDISPSNTAKIDNNARKHGVSAVDILSSPTIDGGGYYYKKFVKYALWPFFPYDIRVYTRDSDAEAYWLDFDMLGAYLAAGGTNSPLGFPTSDVLVTGPFGLDRIAYFENGCLVKYNIAYPQVKIPCN